MLADYMPVVAVITKARQDKVPNSDGQLQSFRNIVQKELPLTKNVVRVRAVQEELDEGHILPAMGLRELVDLTMQVVPEGLKRAFTAAQKVDIELKKTQSHAIVAGAAASAAGIAAAPIPFSDAIAIVPIQVAMLAGISATFGLSFNESFLGSIVGSIVTGAGGTLAGRAIVSGLLKFVPGLGSIAGGVIAATTAATLTTAFGEAYIAALEMLFIQNNGESPTPEDVVEAFKQNMRWLS